MKNNIIICKANVKNIDRLCELLNELFSFEKEFIPNKSNQENALNKILKNSQIGTIFVIKINNYIIGMINILYTISTATGSKVAILEDFIIDKDYQNNGYGTKLINHVIQYCKENNINRITLLTDDTNHKAKEFYRKIGFGSVKYSVSKLELKL